MKKDVGYSEFLQTLTKIIGLVLLKSKDIKGIEVDDDKIVLDIGLSATLENLSKELAECVKSETE